MYHQLYLSPVGNLRIVADDIALRQLWLPNEVEQRQPEAGWIDGKASPIINQVITMLSDYFAGKIVCFTDIPCEPEGSEFQKAVWQQLKNIGYAEIVSYGDIAAAINKPKGAQAVGGAVGANPIAIILPCHRVLGRSGTLTGYSGGLTVKKALLDLEGISYKENRQYSLDY
ncbi:Methylated-DNA--protein-cysteine methyltransferase, constitutive [Pragia fontium]|uniref:methylated-DNA--[protein]-cysteine S-methyltransferase n=1 Tax=Pragia fontium TaxID=82985 RepID=UPI000E039A09|nr:methylated-DNA--[protein]-cysteine S-methyltransferase [Pragia fontium]SUB82682.1 Methylated-DNA--protein-cysteine methyltransferase, constitutive [Pragia fontium]